MTSRIADASLLKTAQRVGLPLLLTLLVPVLKIIVLLEKAYVFQPERRQ